MGKRGPKAHQEFGDQKAVLSTRISNDTRDALEAAAKASGRPLSREVEHRLRRSFDDDAKISETLGGPQLYAMLRMVSAAMTFAATAHSPIPEKSDKEVDWLNNPDAYDRAFWATVRVLDALRPHGDAAPGDDWEMRRKRYGSGAANVILEEVGLADGPLPSPKERLSTQKRLYRRIASDLGEARQRIQPRKEPK
jgi:hypothetical protein